MPELMHANDRDLEATFLGSVMVNPEYLLESWSNLPAEVFYSEEHRRFWLEMRSQHRDHEAFDAGTLASAFRERNDLDSFFGTYSRIVGTGLADYHPTAAYAHVYAARLKRFYVMREKAKAIRKYEAATLSSPDDPDARLELELILHVLDDMLTPQSDQSDEELARVMGDEGRYETGFPDIDRVTGGFARPGLNIVAARPSVGKSAFARKVIREAAARGDRVLWYSKDQSENQILELEMARAQQMDSSQVRKLPFERRIAGIRYVRERVWHDRVRLIDRPIPLPELLTVAKTEQPALMVIDYLQILDTGHQDEYESITAASKALKTLAFQLRIPILALAQFNRGHQAGKPSMTNLRGSGQIEQDADQIYALDRDTTLNTTEAQEATIYVLKNKTGGAGAVTLHWHGQYASYESATRRDFA